MRHKVFLLPSSEKLWEVFKNFSTCTVSIPLVTSPNVNDTFKHKMKNHCVDMIWIRDQAPSYRVSSRNIEILKEPSEFFQKLKDLAKVSTSRITLASLYIGTTSLEKDLVSCIDESLQKSKGSLSVKILLDFTRGSRGKENSRTLLLPLLHNYPSQVQISLYHTPKLRGFIKWLLKERWNEIIGLSHLKVYLFDDTLILSGANLSDQYFTNRQDRYIIFHNCKELCDYFDNLVSIVSSMSFLLKHNNTVELHHDWKIHPSEGNFKNFVTTARKRVENFIASAKETTTHNIDDESDEACDTIVHPIIQMYTFGIRQDEKIIEKFLQTTQPGSFIKLASGYFNLTNHYMNIILNSSHALFSLLVASPKVNGFYGASGISGAIPMVYTYIAKRFFYQVQKYKQQKRIELHEYERTGWTFHVKGLWYYEPHATLPSVTFVGSPNFGYRSVYKDLEAQVVLVTKDKELQMQLHKEQQRLYNLTTRIDKQLFEREDRKVSLWVKFVTSFIRGFF